MPPRGKRKANAARPDALPAASTSSAIATTSSAEPPTILRIDGRKRPRQRSLTQEEWDEIFAPDEEFEFYMAEAKRHGDHEVFKGYIASLGKSWSKKWVWIEAVEVVKLHLEKRVRGSKRVEGDQVVFMDWSELVDLMKTMEIENSSMASTAWWARGNFYTEGFDFMIKQFGTELRDKYGLGDDLDDDSPEYTAVQRKIRNRRREEMKDFGGYFPKQPIYRICILCAECQDTPEEQRDEILSPTEMEEHQAVYHTPDETMWRWVSRRSRASGEDTLCCLVCKETREERDELLDHMLVSHDTPSILQTLPERHRPALVAAIELQDAISEHKGDMCEPEMEVKDGGEVVADPRPAIGGEEQDVKPSVQ